MHQTKRARSLSLRARSAIMGKLQWYGMLEEGLVLEGVRLNFAHHVEDGAGKVSRHFLRKMGEADCGGFYDFAGIGLVDPERKAHQGGFSSAVAAGEADALAPLDLKSDAV